MKFPKTLVGISVFLDGASLDSPVTSVTLPTIKLKTVEATEGPYGFDAPGLLEKLDGTSITTAGVCPNFMFYAGAYQKPPSIKIIGAWRRQGETDSKVEIIMRGIPSLSGDTWTSGDKMSHTYNIGCIEALEIKVDGNPLVDIDYKAGKCRLGANDIYEPVKSLLEL